MCLYVIKNVIAPPKTQKPYSKKFNPLFIG